MDGGLVDGEQWQAGVLVVLLVLVRLCCEPCDRDTVIARRERGWAIMVN